MALVPDNSQVGGIALGGSGSASFTYTMGAGANGRVDLYILANGNTVNTPTYGGVAMTPGAAVTVGGRNMYWFYLMSPATGANNFVVTSPQHWWGLSYSVESVTGAQQTTLGNYAAASGTEAPSVPFVMSLLTKTAGSWMEIAAYVPATGDTISASTGTTQRSRTSGSFIGDSNGGLPVQTNSMSVTTGGTDAFFAFVVEVEVFVAASLPAKSTIVGQAINRSNSY
jgi:hypothetical protein